MPIHFDYFHSTNELMSLILLINCILSHYEKGDELTVQFWILQTTMILFFYIVRCKKKKKLGLSALNLVELFNGSLLNAGCTFSLT